MCEFLATSLPPSSRSPSVICILMCISFSYLGKLFPKCALNYALDMATETSKLPNVYQPPSHKSILNIIYNEYLIFNILSRIYEMLYCSILLFKNS